MALPIFNPAMTPVISQLVDDVFKTRFHTKWDNPSLGSSKKTETDPIDIKLYIHSLSERGIMPSSKRPNTVNKLYRAIWDELSTFVTYGTIGHCQTAAGYPMISPSSEVAFGIKTINPNECGTYIGKIPGREIYFFIRVGGWPYNGSTVPAYNIIFYNLSTAIILSTDTTGTFQVTTNPDFKTTRELIKLVYQINNGGKR